MKKEKISDALLVIVTGFIVLFFLNENSIFLYVSLGVGIVGILIKPLGRLIALGWYKLGDILGYVVSKVVLAIVFYFLLMPIALLHNLFNKDVLQLKNRKDSNWSIREYLYKPDDFKNIF